MGRRIEPAIVVTCIAMALATLADGVFTGEDGTTEIYPDAAAVFPVEAHDGPLAVLPPIVEGVGMAGDRTHAEAGGGVLQPPFGSCPGAPPADGGMHRTPDSAKDGNGNMHMVWSESVDGNLEVCHTMQPGEMGLGSERNSASRITDTPTDSVDPHISIDATTGMAYVVWVEEYPAVAVEWTSEIHAEAASLLYAASEDTIEWSRPIAISDVPGPVKDFEVDLGNGTVKFGDAEKGSHPPGGSGPQAHYYSYVFDSDGDGLKDSDELLATFGSVTLWYDSDTDGDGLDDGLEYAHGFDPLENDINGPLSQLFAETLVLVSDSDSDGIPYDAEVACDLPVYSNAAVLRDGGSISYRFWPMAGFDATLTLVVRVLRHGVFPTPPPESAVYSLDVAVDAHSTGTYGFSYSGMVMEGDRDQITFGSFLVAADERTDVTIDVSLDTPPDGYRVLAIYSIMIHSSTPPGDFSYKDGGDSLPDATLASFVMTRHETCGDPSRPDMFLEVDLMRGHVPSVDVYSEAVNAFSDAGIVLHYYLDEMSMPLDEATSVDRDGDGARTLSSCDGPDEVEDFLAAHKNSASPFEYYMHVVFGHLLKAPNRDDCVSIIGESFSASLASDKASSGIIIADEEIDEPISTATVMQQRMKIMSHELGHGLGASHEVERGLYNPCVDGGGGADTLNHYNIMAWDGISGAAAVEYRIKGVGNSARCKGAVEFVGMPRFSVESINQFDLRNKLSVDTGRNIELLGNYV